MASPEPTFRVLSLFSGAGGMDIGLERTGRFEIMACVEKIPAFCETLRQNVAEGRLGTHQTQIFEGDISQMDPAQILAKCNLAPGDIDVVAGGPPCQTFSTAGRRGTIQDARGLLLWDYLRFVAFLQPKFFIMENVRGLLSAGISHRPISERPDKGGPPLAPEEQPGSVVAFWLADMAKATANAYRIDCFEVNAVNYGAPQLRERVIFIGNRISRLLDFPEPTHGGSGNAKTNLFSSEPLPFATLGDALANVLDDDGEIMDFSPRKKSFLAQVPEGGNWRTLPEDIQRESMGKAWHAKGGRSGWWRRLSRGLPCPTVVTMPNHAGTAMCHPTETRALTLRECAAIQEFPTDWRFCGTTAAKYTQVGNALPIRLAEVAGNVVADGLDSHAVQFTTQGLPTYRRVYLRSHVRTRQWYRAGQVFTWVDGENNTDSEYSAVGRVSKLSRVAG